MSKRTWNSLSAEQQQALTDMRPAGSKLIGAGWDKAEREGKAAAEKSGSIITVLNDAETAKLKEMVSYVEDEWVADANKAGQDGKALMESLRATIQKHQ
jgi:TRAP-type C4-dicarboxylate transport system substrate-binding protein